MSWLEDFDCEMITKVKILGLGTIASYELSGQPVYGTAVTRYDSAGAVWQLSSTQQFNNDRIGNPSTHMIVLEPSRVTGTIIATDYAQITINGVLHDFDLYVPDDILGIGDIIQITAKRKTLNE
jgi:hypothetical protein